MKARCLNPRPAWICGTIVSKSDGVVSPNIVFSEEEARHYFYSRFGNVVGHQQLFHNKVDMPCGKCLACQIRKRKEWTVRLTHESQCYDDNCCFITLTYNDDNIPVTDFKKIKNADVVQGDNYPRVDCKLVDRGLGELPLLTLLPSDVQKFVKRLRRHLEYVPKSASKRSSRDHIDTPIRYYAVGEYGGKYGRPHYHLMIFGWKPSDMEFHSSRNNVIVYRSKQIEKLWKYGFSTVEPVQGGVAKYCSRYVTKKFARLSNDDPFADCVFPEFCLQSVRNGGIGATWFDKNYDLGMFERGYVTMKSSSHFIKSHIPIFYWNRCRKLAPVYWLSLRESKIQYMRVHGRVVDGLEDLQRSVNKYAFEERRLRQSELF